MVIDDIWTGPFDDGSAILYIQTFLVVIDSWSVSYGARCILEDSAVSVVNPVYGLCVSN